MNNEWRKNRLVPLEQNRLAVQYNKNFEKPAWTNPLKRLQYIFAKDKWLNDILVKEGSVMDYPYPNLREYLHKRGMWHLAEYVPWCASYLRFEGTGNDDSIFEKSCFARSKHFINIIKQRIRLFGSPSLNREILTNEAQIRLMSSVWYAMKYLKKHFLALFVFTLLLRLHFNGWQIRMCFTKLFETDSMITLVNSNYVFVSFWALAVYSMEWIKDSIERSIHYMRNREVVIVLEAAYTMDCSLFSDIHKKNGGGAISDKNGRMATHEGSPSKCDLNMRAMADEFNVLVKNCEMCGTRCVKSCL